ncbi:ABC transporter permease [Dongia soli]|uniref:ABC transporter permease n=1 Tax=Dongia soli TaxID=600628 RepID=A0ABU5EBL6_9PROT|nr:ABC transporter permease [Dongia soli]MDY0883768.1 ABC transporter permease [Dongia soli]
MESHVTHQQRLWLYLLTVLVICFLVLPSLIVIPMSFSGANSLMFPPKTWSLRWYDNFIHSPQWLEATWVSVRVAFFTTLLATPIGTAAAYGLHVGRFVFAPVIYGMLIAALMVPVILIAVGAFFLFAQLDMINTIPALVLCDTLLAVPFVLVTVAAGFKGYDMNQEQVARSLGAHRFKAFMTVTLPQIRASVMAGGFFAFIIAFDEVVIAIFMSGGEGATLTNLMFSSLRDQVDPTIAAISTLMIVLTTIPPLAVHILSLKRQRR